MSKHYLYSTWYWLNKQQEQHKVDDAWRDFSTFLTDLGDRPSEKHRLHKVDKTLGYVRGNVIWREMLKHSEGFTDHTRYWIANNRDKTKQYKLKNRFNLTEIEYQMMLEAQKNSCAICGIHESKVEKRLSVDHCHSTGKIRGLLCADCNFMLGWSRDNIENLQKGITYLQQFDH